MANFRSFPLTVTSQDICFIDSNQRGGSFHNNGANTAYILFDLTDLASETNFTVDLHPGDHYEVPVFLQGRVAAASPGGTTINVTLRAENAFI